MFLRVPNFFVYSIAYHQNAILIAKIPMLIMQLLKASFWVGNRTLLGGCLRIEIGASVGLSVSLLPALPPKVLRTCDYIPRVRTEILGNKSS